MAGPDTWRVGAGWSVTLHEASDYTTIVMSHGSLNGYNGTQQVMIRLQPLGGSVGLIQSATISGCFYNLHVWNNVPGSG